VGAAAVRIDTDHDHHRPAVRDFLDFRRESLASFIALGCRAARDADPRARRTYSSIGVLFSQFDRHLTSEDPRLIARRCREAGAPLDHYGLNSYLNLNSREGFHLGLSAEIARAATGLPVRFTEIGVTSTEEYLNIGEDKQGRYLRAQILESILDGVPQLHVFTWNDKPYVSRRERGFGLVRDKREDKPALAEVEDLGRRLAALDLGALGRDLTQAHRDRMRTRHEVAFLLPDAERGMDEWNSWLDENWIVASYFRRLGYAVGFVAPEELADPERVRAIAALVLCRQGLASLGTLRLVRDRVLGGGAHVIALSGAPGQARSDEDPAAWRALMTDLFGLSFDPSLRYEELQPEAMFHYAVLAPSAPARAVFSPWLVELPSRASAPGVTASPETLRFVGPRPTRSHAPPELETFVGRELPLYTVFRRDGAGGAAGVYIGISLGYLLASDHPELGREGLLSPQLDTVSSHQNQVIARVLGDLLGRRLGLPPPAPPDDGDLVGADLRIVRRAALRPGGELVFVQHVPELARTAATPCPATVQVLHVDGLRPGDTLVSLTGERDVTVDERGRARVELRACGSDLLLSRAALPRYQRRAAPPPPSVSAPARADAFPARVYYHLDAADGSGCLRRRLEELGYTAASLGIGHAPDYSRWWAEPMRGYYPMRSVDSDLWNERFGVLAFDAPARFSPSLAEAVARFLEGPEHRVVIHLPDGAAPLDLGALGPRRDRLALFRGDCGAVTKQALAPILRR
jgi:hypothetical protein